MKEEKMGLASFQLNIFAMKQQLVAATRRQMAKEEEASFNSAQMTKLRSSNTEWYKDNEYAKLQVKEQQFDDELKTLDTKVKDIEKNIEALEKGRDDDLKRGIPSLAS